MNANQTRTGGVRKSLGRRIGEWLGGRERPARGRSRTRTAPAVEAMEGRIVLNATPQVAAQVAQEIVQIAAQVTYYQPQQLPYEVNYLESQGVLNQLLSQQGDRFLSQSDRLLDYCQVNIDVAIDLSPVANEGWGPAINAVAVSENNASAAYNDAYAAYQAALSAQSGTSTGGLGQGEMNYMNKIDLWMNDLTQAAKSSTSNTTPSQNYANLAVPNSLQIDPSTLFPALANTQSELRLLTAGLHVPGWH